MKWKLAFALIALGSLAFLSPSALASAPMMHPHVIGGTPGSPLASAAVALDFPDGECTGSLWRSRIIVTAAHCLSDEESGSPTVNAADIRVYLPGADKAAGPVGVRVTQVIFDPNWTANSDDGEQAERDIAYLILDAPLGTPTWSRMATPDEVMEIARTGAPVEYVGYGLTGPRDDPAAQSSPVPLSLTTRLVEGYSGGLGEFTTAGDRVRGTCAGDSGGPFLATLGGQVLYLGPLSGGLGFPCESQDEKPSDSGAVASGMAALAKQALAAAGEGPEATPTTCMRGPDVEQSCILGTIWSYDYCWSGKKAILQARGTAGWRTLARVTGRRTQECPTSTPYEIRFSRVVTGPRTAYRVVLPKQPGLRRGAVDPFMVTSG